MAQIICEVGQNHMGDMTLAKQLISLAQANGGDLCKFQLYDHNILYKDHPEIPNVALSFDQAKMLFDYGKEVGIEVFFSVFDIEKVKWCERIGVRRYKIAFSQRWNLELIDEILLTKKPYLISVSEWGDCGYMTRFPDQLYCVSKYPSLLREISFSKMRGCNGFSDHTIGLDAAKIALARGAKIIEKHFAIDHNTGIDAQWSMTPDELRELKRWEVLVRQVL